MSTEPHEPTEPRDADPAPGAGGPPLPAPSPGGPPPPPLVVEPVVASPRRGRAGRIAAAVVGLAALALVVAVAAVQLAPPPPVPPRIAVVRPDGALVIVDAAGSRVAALGGGGDLRFGPPAWSPDGTRLAAIGSGPGGAAIHVFDVGGLAGAADGEVPVPSRVVYDSGERPPFYLSWSPDGSRVGFLATEGDEITLRTAPGDGTATRDGTAGDGILRVGAPLYFAWQGGERLLLHVGFGEDAFTGRVDTAGAEDGAPFDGSGDFRTAVVSPDGGSLAYVRGRPDDGSVVLAGPDGTVRAEVPVRGPAALAFDPRGTTLAVVAAAAEPEEPLGFPLGPLRLVGPDGAARTLVDGDVAAAWWSPDGATIATLRLVPGGGNETASTGGVRQAVADPDPAPEVRLSFVRVADGEVRSDRRVRLGRAYVTTILPYFDQYALSHGVWAPDGSGIVLPLEDGDGVTRVTVLGVDGEDRPITEAVHATWAP